MKSPVPGQVLQSCADNLLVFVAESVVIQLRRPSGQAAIGVHGGDVKTFLDAAQALRLRLQWVVAGTVGRRFRQGIGLLGQTTQPKRFAPGQVQAQRANTLRRCFGLACRGLWRQAVPLAFDEAAQAAQVGGGISPTVRALGRPDRVASAVVGWDLVAHKNWCSSISFFSYF